MLLKCCVVKEKKVFAVCWSGALEWRSQQIPTKVRKCKNGTNPWFTFQSLQASFSTLNVYSCDSRRGKRTEQIWLVCILISFLLCHMSLLQFFFLNNVICKTLDSKEDILSSFTWQHRYIYHIFMGAVKKKKQKQTFPVIAAVCLFLNEPAELLNKSHTCLTLKLSAFPASYRALHNYFL